MTSEQRLVRDLIRNVGRIGREARPVYNSSETMKINFGVALIHIDRVDPGPDGNPNRKDVTMLTWNRYVSKDFYTLL